MEAIDVSGADGSHLKSSAPGNDSTPLWPHTSFVQVSAKGETKARKNLFYFAAIKKKAATHELLSHRDI